MSLSSIFSRERPAVSKISKQCIKHVPRTKFRKAKMPVFLGSILLVFVQALETAWQILTDGYVSTEVKIHFNCHTWPIGLIGPPDHPQAGTCIVHQAPAFGEDWQNGPNKTLPKCCFVQSIMALFEIVSLVSFVSFRFFKMIGEMEVALLKMSDFFWVFFLA